MLCKTSLILCGPTVFEFGRGGKVSPAKGAVRGVDFELTERSLADPSAKLLHISLT